MRKTIVLGICASIAAYKACEIINRLRDENIDLVVCMSRDADKFVTPLTLQTLSGNRVFNDMFECVTETDPTHISLADRASAVLIAPATADFISKIACGICDDLLSCVVSSTTAPVSFAPAMNTNMYKNKILQANIEKLKSLGYYFIDPIKGRLACGKEGVGHIADIADIKKHVTGLLK
ncbi:flavoprotein [Candidatus Omnitrophota bacterium]